MTDLLYALQSQTSPVVQLWMSWMIFIFLAGVLFARQHPQARRALLALTATAFLGYIFWTMTGNVHLLGLSHILIWLPLAIYLWKTTLSKQARKHDGESDTAKYKTLTYRAFFLWVCLLFVTIVVSLVFDLRDIALVMAGGK